MHEDADLRVATVIAGLVRLGRLLPPEDFEDLLGAVAAEVETGMELVLERRMPRRGDGNVVRFPGPCTDRGGS